MYVCAIICYWVAQQTHVERSSSQLPDQLRETMERRSSQKPMEMERQKSASAWMTTSGALGYNPPPVQKFQPNIHQSSSQRAPQKSSVQRSVVQWSQHMRPEFAGRGFESSLSLAQAELNLFWEVNPISVIGSLNNINIQYTATQINPS